MPENRFIQGEGGRFAGSRPGAQGEQGQRAVTVEDLASDEVQSLQSYASMAYTPVNAILRGTEDAAIWESSRSSVEKIVEKMDAAFAKASFPEDAVLERIVSNDVFNKIKASVGGTFTDDGFVSASRLGADVSVREGKKIQIWVRKGAKALDISGVSHLPREKEVVLNRGSSFKVTKVRGGGIRLDMV